MCGLCFTCPSERYKNNNSNPNQLFRFRVCILYRPTILLSSLLTKYAVLTDLCVGLFSKLSVYGSKSSLNQLQGNLSIACEKLRAMTTLSRVCSRARPRYLSQSALTSHLIRTSLGRNPTVGLRPACASFSVPMAASLSTMSTIQAPHSAVAGLREYDPEIKDVASYVHNYKIDSDLAVSSVLLVGNRFAG